MRKNLAVIAGLLVAVLAAGAWLAYPMSAVAWAAWVQAAGVLAAIWWSVRLQSRQSEYATRQATQVAVIFAANMHWVFRELNDACAKRSWPDYVVNRRILDEILSQGRAVPVQTLEGRSLAMVSSLRTIAVEALEISVAHTADGNWPLYQAFFDKRLPSISGWLSATGNPPESSGPTDYAGLRTSMGPLR